VHRWLDGESVNVERMADPVGLARDLGGFVAALRRIETAGGPIPGHDGSRGLPLARRDAATREAIAQLDGVIDTRAVTAAWEAAVRAPTWQRPGVWIHGDLLSGNVLVDGRGRLSAVIDFGCMVVGDPACDVMAAWTLFSAEGREAFRSAIGVDDAAWVRGRGWALSFALIALPYYMHTNPVFVRDARHVIREVLADQA
jgi:aminoglycoside phosphotransferase (APT) family kinase protein